MVFADPLFGTDAESNYTDRGENVEFEPRGEVLGQDRAEHSYTFKFVGDGERLSAKFIGWKRRGFEVNPKKMSLPGLFEVELVRPSRVVPIGERSATSAAVPWKLGAGLLMALVLMAIAKIIDLKNGIDVPLQDDVRGAVLSVRDDLRGALLYWERRAQGKAARRREEWRAVEEEKVRRRFGQICLDYQFRDPLGDDRFLADYARKNKSNLLNDRSRIEQRCRELHEDRALVAMLRRERPEIYERAIGEMRALTLAQRFDVEAPPAPPPRKKISPEEFRARMIRREQIRREDKIERGRARVEAMLEARQMLEQYELDEADRSLLGQELLADLLNDDGPDGKVM